MYTDIIAQCASIHRKIHHKYYHFRGHSQIWVTHQVVSEAFLVTFSTCKAQKLYFWKFLSKIFFTWQKSWPMSVLVAVHSVMIHYGIPNWPGLQRNQISPPVSTRQFWFTYHVAFFCYLVSMTQCENFRIFLSLIFYVKSILESL